MTAPPDLAARIDAIARITGQFTLRSGQQATEYFDKYRFEADPALLVEAEVELAVQVNGKIRDRVTVPADADEEAVKAQVLSSPRVQASFDGKSVQKIVVVPGKLVNIVVR